MLSALEYIPLIYRTLQMVNCSFISHATHCIGKVAKPSSLHNLILDTRFEGACLRLRNCTSSLVFLYNEQGTSACQHSVCVLVASFPL